MMLEVVHEDGDDRQLEELFLKLDCHESGRHTFPLLEEKWNGKAIKFVSDHCFFCGERIPMKLKTLFERSHNVVFSSSVRFDPKNDPQGSHKNFTPAPPFYFEAA